MIWDCLSFSKYPNRELIQGTFLTFLKFMTRKDYKLLTCFNWLLSLFKCYVIWNYKWINLVVFNSKNKVCLGALNFANNDEMKKNLHWNCIMITIFVNFFDMKPKCRLRNIVWNDIRWINEMSLFRNDSMSNYAYFYSVEHIMEFSDAATWKFRLFSFKFYWKKKMGLFAAIMPWGMINTVMLEWDTEEIVAQWFFLM